MRGQPPEDSIRPPDAGDARPDHKGVKYLPLLEPDSHQNSGLWEEFVQDLRVVCLRMPSLRGEADDHVQDALEILYKRLDRMRRRGINPWFSALRTLKLKSFEANRRLQKERRNVSITPDDSRERGAKEEGEVLNALRGGTAESPHELLERQEEEKARGTDAETQSRFESAYEGCLGSAILGLPDERERMLYEDYYSLKTHDAAARKKLVESYHLSSYDNLQVKIHRMVGELTKAVEECMGKAGFPQSAGLGEKEKRKMVRRYTKNFYHPE